MQTHCSVLKYWSALLGQCWSVCVKSMLMINVLPMSAACAQMCSPNLVRIGGRALAALQNAQIQILDKDLKPTGDVFPVQYNPTEFTLSKGVQIAEIAIPGLDSPILQFVRGQTETLTLDLFFDTTDRGMDDSAVSVTTKTDKFYQLIKINKDTHAPPICRFTW